MAAGFTAAKLALMRQMVASWRLLGLEYAMARLILLVIALGASLFT